MEEKYVYVIYDPLYERVVCVHDESEKECEICELIQKERKGSYYLKEHKHLIQTTMEHTLSATVIDEFAALSRILHHSFDPIDWEYDNLTPSEKTVLSPLEFQSIKDKYKN